MPRKNPHSTRQAIARGAAASLAFMCIYTALLFGSQPASGAAFLLATGPLLLMMQIRVMLTATPGVSRADREALDEKHLKATCIASFALIMALIISIAKPAESYGLVLAGIMAIPVWTNTIECRTIIARYIERNRRAAARYKYLYREAQQRATTK